MNRTNRNFTVNKNYALLTSNSYYKRKIRAHAHFTCRGVLSDLLRHHSQSVSSGLWPSSCDSLLSAPSALLPRPEAVSPRTPAAPGRPLSVVLNPAGPGLAPSAVLSPAGPGRRLSAQLKPAGSGRALSVVLSSARAAPPLPPFGGSQGFSQTSRLWHDVDLPSPSWWWLSGDIR